MSTRRFGARGFARDTGGAAAVEFAIVSTAFLTFLFAIAYLGIIMFTDATLHWAVEKGSRLAAINAAVTQTEVANAINGYLAASHAPTASVSYTVSQSGTLKTGNIAATFTKYYTVPMISTFEIHYSATAAVPLGS